MVYNSGGTLKSYRNVAGKRWTTIYDATPHLTAIQDPFNRRTSWVFDAGTGKIRRIQDRAGRITPVNWHLATCMCRQK